MMSILDQEVLMPWHWQPKDKILSLLCESLRRHTMTRNIISLIEYHLKRKTSIVFQIIFLPESLIAIIQEVNIVMDMSKQP